jgi:sirohydrochlorin cobaltochelatase
MRIVLKKTAFAAMSHPLASARALVALLSVVVLSTLSSPASAQPPLDKQAAASPVGTIVVAHGGSKEWNDEVRAVVAQAKLAGPLELSFLMGPEAATTRFQDVAARLVSQGARRLIVVPLLVSSHSEHYEQIRYLAGATDSVDQAIAAHMHHGGLEPAKVDVPVHVARGLDDSPAIARALADRALALGQAPAQQALFLVGHGPNSAEDYAWWMSNLRTVADSVQRFTGFRDVRIDLVRDDAPAHVRAEAVRRVRELIAMQHTITGRPVVVVPVLISRGRVSRETFLADLAGLPVIYSGDPLLPHPGLARWIEERVRESINVSTVASPNTP